jgi:hypothetical protein
MRKTAIALVLIGLAALIVWNTPKMLAQIGSPEPGSIDALAQAANSNGETMVTAPIMPFHEDVEGFDEAKVAYTVVVAQAVSSQSYAISDFNIETAVTFNVTETLKSNSPHLCVSGTCAVPAGVAAPAANQLLLLRAGGSIVRNGVTVNQEWAELPDFTPGQSYMLFIDYDSSNRVGVPALGPVGVFLVSSAGTVSSLITDPDKASGLQDDITERYANSLSQIRSVLNPQPPTTCNSAQEQDCYDNGGTWNSSTCQCTLPFDPCLKKPWLCE